ncbi:MAG TPA: VWA domain-containing protein [Kofleriaceae bacterium]|nr:VWA domain-containing protein [Kofleriaceae bacterium]
MRVGIPLAAVAATAVAIAWWLGDATSLELAGFERPVELLAPGYLVLLALVPAIFAARVLSLTDLSRLQLVVQATLRSLVIAAFAIALARPTWVTEHHAVATVVLVDVSDSVTDAQLADAQRYVDGLRRASDHVQLVTFAEQPRLAHAVARHPGAGAGTDIAAAIQLAFGVLPDGFVPRLVVVSDGNQTQGDAELVAIRARELGASVSWRMFAAAAAPEVRVASLAAPDDVKAGSPFDVTAEVWSSEPQTVTLALDQDGFGNPRLREQTVALRAGKNLVKFPSVAPRAGSTRYQVRLARVEHDTVAANNTAVTVAPVAGRPNVLYVEGAAQPGAARHLTHALEHEGIDVTARTPSGLPRTAPELAAFDLVVVSDVAAHVLGSAQLAALDTYVRGGGGLVFAAGESASAGYAGSRLEAMLPVRFDGKQVVEQPNVALALVIDRSDSMAGDKLEAAKESARATAEALSPRDRIAVIAFDSGASTLVELQPAANRMRISSEIARLSPGGGTNIHAGLKQAYDALAAVDAKVKHVILLTDGVAPPDGIVDLVQEMRADRITVSAVGVRGAERRLLEQIIEAGDGRLEMIDDLGQLPRFFVDETHLVHKSALVEESVHVRVAKRVELLERVAIDTAPALRGYVSTTAKPTAETILVAESDEPILARWRHGAGTVVAWTSDVTSRWSADWLGWSGYPKLWGQIARTTMRREVYARYELAARVVDGTGVVTVEALDSDDRFVNELDTELAVIDPATGRVKRTLAMQQTAAGHYTARLPLDGYGSFLLEATHRRDGKIVAKSVGSIALSYPLEYARSTPDTDLLRRLATLSGGHGQPDAARVLDAGGQSVPAREELWPYVLLVLAGLFVLDLYAKRIRLFGHARHATRDAVRTSRM